MRTRLAAGLFSVLISSLFVAPAGAADVPAATSAQASEAQAQRMRAAAEAKAGDKADPASLRQAASEMESVVAYLDGPDVRALGTGFLPLYYRSHDVHIDLAGIYARLGETNRALDHLEAAQAYMWFPGLGQIVQKNPAFASLRGEPRLQALLKTGAVPGHVWPGPAADQAYRERLGVEERIAGLSLFWAEARTYFVHFDHVPDLDWNRVYLDYLPKVMAAETTADYYRVLMQLAPLLRDGHTNIYPPAALANRFFARPPVTTMLVEDKVLVDAVSSASLAERLHPGEEIVAIDGIPVRRYAEEHVAPFVSSSTPQDRDVRMYGHQLLAGAADTPLRLFVRDANGREREETVARSGYQDVRARQDAPFRMLPGSVAYLAVDQFENDAGAKALRAALPQILQAKALVIDVRRNGGGATEFGNQVLAYLTEGPIPHARSYRRYNSAEMRARGMDAIMWEPQFEFPAKPRAPRDVFKGKVAVLTGPKTFSAGEDFVLAFNALKRGITVGETTGGSTGQPMMFALPGGGTARICAKRDLLPDGRPFVGIGLAPTVAVRPTVASVRAGTDPVLERALAELGGAAR